MRLTLRTLLAYLDEILDPSDSDQLRKKIEDSEFATTLVHQIRGSVRRLRLDAPALDAQGIGGDLNSVAEYLDNTLPPDQVPTLEKACLENEVNLGEVASCHQILTLVLGQAAEVNESMRQSAYAIAPTIPSSTVQPPTDEPSSAGVETAGPAPTIMTPPPAPSVQDTDISPYPSVVPTVTRLPSEASNALPPPTTATASIPPKRPSQRFKKPQDVPSTKETWRAESRQNSIPAAPVGTATPDYLPAERRQSSWLRSLAIGVLVTFLIVAGLLVAGGPINRTFVRWLGFSEPMNVSDLDPPKDKGSQSTVISSDSTAEVVRIDQPNPAPERIQPWNDNLVANHEASADTIEPPAAFPPMEAPPITEPVVAAPIMEEAAEDGMADGSKEPIGIETLPLVNPGETSVVGREQPRDVPPFPESAATAIVITEVPDDPLSPNVRNENSTDVSRVSDLVSAPVSEPLPHSIDKAGPSVGATAVNTVDAPAIDLELAPVNPPVATSTVAPPTVDSTDFPEPSTPDPRTPRVMQPTRLKGGQLLLTYDESARDWGRVDSTLELVEGTPLMSLPAFQADIEIGTNVTCTMVGATRLQLGPESNVTLHEGQLLLTLTRAKQSQGIQHRGEVFDIWTADEDGMVAIEATRVHIPGNDPLHDLTHTVLRIFANTNDATVRYRGTSYDLPAGQQLVRLDNFAPRIETGAKKPAWMGAAAMSRADSSSVRAWKADLGNVKDIPLWLQEKANNSRYAERALASRCLAEMNQFDHIVAALDDPEQRSFWGQQFDSLQKALTRGPEAVNQLMFELEKAHGEDAPGMFEMIRGYDGRQLLQGSAAKLVEYLSHDSLDRRVLAILNLKGIIGYTLDYRAEDNPAKRRKLVNAWKGRLKNGHVNYKEPPEIVSLLESFTTPVEE